MIRKTAAPERSLEVVALFLVAVILSVAVAALAQQEGANPLHAKPSGELVPQEPGSKVRAWEHMALPGAATSRRGRDLRARKPTVAAPNSGIINLLPAVTYDTGGHNPSSVAVADVNGDGTPDLIVANQATPKAR